MLEFSVEMRGLARGVERQAKKLVRDLGAAMIASLVVRTPVGGPPTSPRDPHPGLARSNWTLTTGGAPSAAIREPEDAAQTVARAQSQRPGDEVTISNFVPYIGALNDGSSTQAPAGFVESALEEALVEVAQAEILVE